METVNEVRHLLPTPVADGINNRPARLNKFAEAIVEAAGPNRGAEEGSRYVVTNPTLGTAIATTTSITAFTSASPVMVVGNGNGVGGRNIVFDYLRLLWGQVPTSATTWHWAATVDSANRYTSGGSTLTPANVNTGGSPSSARVYFGEIVAPAASAAVRIVHRSVGRSAIPVINDEVLFQFGGKHIGGAGSLGGTVALRLPIPCGPVVLRPGDYWVLYGWAASNAAAPTWELEFGFSER